MTEYQEKVLDEKCENCGTRLKQVPTADGEKADIMCPNHYREGKFEDCKEVVEELN